MSATTYPEPTVQVQLSNWWEPRELATEAVRPGQSPATLDSLYDRMLKEYASIDFGPAQTRTPLKEIHPV